MGERDVEVMGAGVLNGNLMAPTMVHVMEADEEGGGHVIIFRDAAN